MASLFKEKGAKNGSCFRIQFVDSNGKRRSLRLGDVPRKVAETLCSRIEEIIAYQKSHVSMPTEIAVWLCELGDDLYEKLANVDLIPHRRTTELGEYLNGYIERRKDVKKGTIIPWNLDKKKLIDFFGEDRRIDSISPVDAEGFKQHLFAAKLARATISKHLANAKMFFEAMLVENLVRSNPFAKIAVTAVVDESRNVYVPRDDVFAAMEAAWDVDWKLIIALSRFGGLRSPSEILSLKWECIHWGKNRILILSPKTERHPNGSQQLIPLFPELLEPLRAAWNERKEGAEFVITKHRSQADTEKGWASCNLREPMLDILRRAGVEPWKKLFHGMRASCETDLIDAGFPIQVVTAWMGHSVRIAQKHYLREKEEYYDRAVQFGSSGALSGGETGLETGLDSENLDKSETKSPVRNPVHGEQKGVQQASARSRTEVPRNKKAHKLQALAVRCVYGNQTYCRREDLKRC